MEKLGEAHGVCGSGRDGLFHLVTPHVMRKRSVHGRKTIGFGQNAGSVRDFPYSEVLRLLPLTPGLDQDLPASLDRGLNLGSERPRMG